MGIEELFGGNQDNAEIPAEPAPTVEPEPVIEAPVDAAIEQPPVVAEPEPQPHMVPLNVLHEVRDELKETKRRLQEMEQQRQAAPIDSPDPYDDPHGFAAHQNAQVQQALINQRFQTSDLIARQQHGAETVEAAAAWATERAQRDPGFAQSYMQQPHPIDWIVQQHKRDGLLNEIGDNVDDWFTREAAKRGYAPAAPIAPALPVAQQQPAPVQPTPPRSLASAPSKGGTIKDVPTGPMASLGAVFQG
ncbi:hypothetical protein ACFSTI_29320 [Rhizorhabdus histidinilytica]|uniref:Uncharacterized protein n=1 Tax=Rhizorhabdus histidinilytica TaxID=439228 RepID=A0A1T5CGV7_9SPHN|nr:hypothetical protein [Rhizorhabdus histidinilytica]SKB58725.1 hypothetical protein SAMN06295920_10457 [Rhizorhabdus histidinilytica]